MNTTIIHRQGNTPLTLVVPHGHVSDNPELAEMALRLHEELGCTVFVNTLWRKSAGNTVFKKQKKKKLRPGVDRIDLERLDQTSLAGLDSQWTEPLVNSVNDDLNAFGSSLVLILQSVREKQFVKAGRENDLLLGTGASTESSGKEQRATIAPQRFDFILQALKRHGFAPLPVKSGEDHQKSKYAGWEKNNLNQLLNRYQFHQDQSPDSMLLTFNEGCVQQSRHHFPALFTEIAEHLKSRQTGEQQGEKTSHPEIVESSPDEHLVSHSIKIISNIFVSHVHDALNEVGTYLVREFFDNDIELARTKKAVKDLSYTRLIKQLQAKNSNGPKKSWLFNSVNLVVQNHDLEGVKEYEHLSGSHRILLLSVKPKEDKIHLARQAYTEKSSVRRFQETIKKFNEMKEPKSLLSLPDTLFSAGNKEKFLQLYASLAGNEKNRIRKKLSSRQASIRKQIEDKQRELAQYEDLIGSLD